MTSDATKEINEQATDAAREWYQANARVRSLEKELEDAKQERQYAANDLDTLLGAGGVIEVDDLESIFVVQPGRRSVNKARLSDYMELLPDSLRPTLVETVKHCTVADIDNVADVLRARDVDPEELVDRGQPTVAVRARDVKAAR